MSKTLSGNRSVATPLGIKPRIQKIPNHVVADPESWIWNHGFGIPNHVVADPSNPEFSVRDALNAKHPPAQPLHPECLLPLADTPAVHPVVFDALDASVVRAAALRTMGVAGPSGIDARGWRRLCTSFRAASDELCGANALFARRLCTSFISPDILSPFLGCRLIALDKSPGVRPIGVCEVVRRIVAKAALYVIRDDIQAAAGPHQLCAGQIARTEAAVHAVRSVFIMIVMPFCW